MIAYSRVYLGVHFVSDVAGGGLFGILAGIVVYLIYRLYRKENGPEIISILPVNKIKTVSIVMMGYIFLLLLYSLLRH